MIDPRTRAIRGEVRLAGYRRLSHGLHLPSRQAGGTSATLDELDAWTLVLPSRAGFTHITAGWLRGWWMPRLPEHVPVFASGPGTEHPRRAGLVYSRLGTCPVSEIHGLPVVAPEEALLRAARDLALFDLTILVTSALRSGDVAPRGLAAMCETHRPGVRALRAACSWADQRFESPFEVLLAFFHELAGIKVEPQHEILDRDGRFVARGDLWVVGTDAIHEYDGEVHQEKEQRVRDLRRDRRLIGTPYVRRGFVADDLFRHPLAMLQELDGAVGRRHRPGRLAPWRRHLTESTFSRAGRQRLQNRWLRLSGPVDWTQTA